MPTSTTNENIVYQYKIVSVDHLDELQEDIDKLRRAGKLSDHEVYRSYIDTKKFQVPETIPNAKFLIVIAVLTKLVLVNFHFDGKKHEFMIPPQYYDDGLELEDLENVVNKEIIIESGYKIERSTKLHLKLLAARSGLGKYGRNNICYVDEMGSLITLYAFFTDFQFDVDNWTEIQMMDYCKRCTTCMNNCPTHAIPTSPEENFVINVGKCLTLYNEIDGEFPPWIDKGAHNALEGCMRCQLTWPGNSKSIKLTQRFDDVTEEETKMILEGSPDEYLLNALSDKIKMFSRSYANKKFPSFKRNLEVLLK